MKKNVLLALGALVFVAILGLVLWFYLGTSRRGTDNILSGGDTNATTTQGAPAESFGGDIYQKTGAANPVEKMPDTNPFEKTVNPYTDAYQNPF